MTVIEDHSLKIGLALSGGGVRAAAFHLGVLARLAADGHLSRVTFISTVSGGSMVVGLIYGLNNCGWPTDEQFRHTVLNEARTILTHVDLQWEYIGRLVRAPWRLFQGRANVMSTIMQRQWGIRASLNELSPDPRWIINATTYETGKNWRFTPQRMGDYVLGYVREPTIPLADAVAASAAYPGGIGPLELASKDFDFYAFEDLSNPQARPTPPSHPNLHLWDGGVYDNLGVEALFKPGTENYRDGYNFLIVSDASAPFGAPKYWWWNRGMRLVGVAMEQVRSLRSRMIVEHLQRDSETGAYLRLGRSAEYILTGAEFYNDSRASIVNGCLAEADVALAAAEGTHLHRLPPAVFDRLCRHGWEVADCTLAAYCPNSFRPRCWAG